METHLARMTRADLIGMVVEVVVAAAENGEDLVVAEAVSEVEEDTKMAGKAMDKRWHRIPGRIRSVHVDDIHSTV